MATRAKNEYPVEDDMTFQRRSWAVERASWILMGAVAVASSLGLLSHGPLSKTTAPGKNSPVSITYERLERREASSRFTLRAAPPEKSTEAALRLGPEFLEAYEVRAVTPAPLRASAGANGFEAVFATSSTGEIEVHVTGRAKRFGFVRFPVEAPGLGSTQVRQFIFP
jgi:hypothetical protein